MTVTEKTAESNLAGEIVTSQPSATATRSKWGEGTCGIVRTYYQNGKVCQQWVSCKALDCSRCGPKRRQADHEKALAVFGQEPVVYCIRVPAERVDHLRKQAGRREHPMKSVPVSDTENIVFSTYRFEGAHVPDSDEIEDIFIRQRVAKRQLTSTGKWARPRRKEFVRPENACQTISKEFVSQEAFENVARRLGKRVKTTAEKDSWWFYDDEQRGYDYYRDLLIREQEEVRKQRLRDRGRHPWSEYIAA